MQKWIQAQTYETLLRCWRFLPNRAAFFMGETGTFAREELHRKKRSLAGPKEAKMISDKVGWVAPHRGYGHQLAQSLGLEW